MTNHPRCTGRPSEPCRGCRRRGCRPRSSRRCTTHNCRNIPVCVCFLYVFAKQSVSHPPPGTSSLSGADPELNSWPLHHLKIELFQVSNPSSWKGQSKPFANKRNMSNYVQNLSLPSHPPSTHVEEWDPSMLAQTGKTSPKEP